MALDCPAHPHDIRLLALHNVEKDAVPAHTFLDGSEFSLMMPAVEDVTSLGLEDEIARTHFLRYSSVTEQVVMLLLLLIVKLIHL